MIYQSIYKRIRGRIEQDHREGNGIRNIVWAVAGAVIAQDVDNSVSQPTDCKDSADCNDHQSDTLPYL